MSDTGAFTKEEASVTEVRTIGIDPEKRSFHLHGVRADGSAAFRKQASRGRVLAELSPPPRCAAAMEAGASAQGRGREVFDPGREVRAAPPVRARPFVKRRKKDAAGAEAVCDAASRPAMRFIAAKSAERQAHGVAFRMRELPVRRRMQAIDALRGRLGGVRDRGALGTGACGPTGAGGGDAEFGGAERRARGVRGVAAHDRSIPVATCGSCWT